MPVRSIRIPDDIESKIFEVQSATPEKSLNAIMVEALRVGLSCLLPDRLSELESRISRIEQQICCS